MLADILDLQNDYNHSSGKGVLNSFCWVRHVEERVMLSLLNSCHAPDKKLCFSPQADGVSLPGLAFWLNALLSMEKAISQAKNPLLEAPIPLAFAFGFFKTPAFHGKWYIRSAVSGVYTPSGTAALRCCLSPTCHWALLRKGRLLTKRLCAITSGVFYILVEDERNWPFFFWWWVYNSSCLGKSTHRVFFCKEGNEPDGLGAASA